jgi:hypothetical protein
MFFFLKNGPENYVASYTAVQFKRKVMISPFETSMHLIHQSVLYTGALYTLRNTVYKSPVTVRELQEAVMVSTSGWDGRK